MKDFLARHWFLLLLTAGLALALGRPGWVEPYTHPLPPLLVVALALFLTAWGLDGRRLYEAIARPLPALGAVALSYGLLPALGLLAGRLLPDPEYRVGLLIITSVPCTLASAVIWTRLAGGGEATALLAVLLTTGTSWLVTTAWLKAGTGTAVRLDTAALMSGLFLALVVPVGLAQLARAVRPLARLADRGRASLGVGARLLTLAIILKAVVDAGSRLGERAAPLGVEFAAAAGLCVAAHLATLAAGLWGGRVLGLDPPTRIAVAFAGSQKTLPVALYLFDTYFREAPLAILPIVSYHVGQLVADTIVADRLARREPAAVPPAA
jgi:sodium/bile acid cotransporter 7